MSLVLPIAAGAAALLVIHESGKGQALAKTAAKASPGRQSLDPGMDSFVAEAVTLAIKNETDKNVLTQFAAALKAANFSNSASAVSARAAQLA